METNRTASQAPHKIDRMALSVMIARMASIDMLFQILVSRKGSDLHMSTGHPPMLRIDGDMPPLDLPAVDGDDMIGFLHEIMPSINRHEFEEHHNTDFAYAVKDLARIRCNVFRDHEGVGAVFRVIPSSVLTADQLNLPKGVRDLCYLSKGLVVVTGPTGSGKSTTLAAMIDLINKTRSDHILTIEDPIEFVHKGQKSKVTQREVKNHTRSFASALRAALRQDPDVILVGEMRDLETIQIAIETSETGHLVFGTLHTNTAISTIDRLIDVFPADRQSQIRAMLASSLRGVVCQMLCKKIGGGRVAALELLLTDSGIASLIRDGKSHQISSSMQVGKAKGMLVLNDSLMAHVLNGIVAPAEAFSKSVDREDLMNRFQKAGISMESETA